MSLKKYQMIPHSEFLLWLDLSRTGGIRRITRTEVKNYTNLIDRGLTEIKKNVKKSSPSNVTLVIQLTNESLKILKKNLELNNRISLADNNSETIEANENRIKKILLTNKKMSNPNYRAVVDGKKPRFKQDPISTIAKKMTPVDAGDFYEALLKMTPDEKARFASRLTQQPN